MRSEDYGQGCKYIVGERTRHIINHPIPASAPRQRGDHSVGPRVSSATSSSDQVGDNPTKVCLAGFYIDYPDPNHPGRQLPAFLTAAQCAQGNTHAPVAVMKADAAGQNPKRTQIGEITYLTAGDENPAIAGEPWTIPTSALALFSPRQPTWILPVDDIVNDTEPTSEIVQTAQPAEQRKAPATWTNSFGVVVTGHVLDPASTPEYATSPPIFNTSSSLPTIRPPRSTPKYSDSDTHNLGVIVGTDETRHWVVVDLISPFLAAQGARLAATS